MSKLFYKTKTLIFRISDIIQSTEQKFLLHVNFQNWQASQNTTDSCSIFFIELWFLSIYFAFSINVWFFLRNLKHFLISWQIDDKFIYLQCLFSCSFLENIFKFYISKSISLILAIQSKLICDSCLIHNKYINYFVWIIIALHWFWSCLLS